ncbi:MAG: gamma-glutamyltransferase, partial [Cyclobacteriaceae bacterium]
MKILKLFLSILSLVAFYMSAAQTYGKNGMVVSASGIASEVGLDILKKGGNAVDASIATAFALAVTHPAAGNIGGGGFMVIMKNDGYATTIDFREKAPLAATQDMFQDENGNLINGLNHYSAKAIGVPGTVAGLYLAHQKYGSLQWAELVDPAVRLAADGFEMNWSLYKSAQYYESRQEDFPQMNEFFRNEAGDIIEPGSEFTQQALSESLARIRDNGHDGFYKGKT